MAYDAPPIGLISRIREYAVNKCTGIGAAVLAMAMYAVPGRADTAVKHVSDPYGGITLDGAPGLNYGAAITKGDINGDGTLDMVVRGVTEIGVFYGNSNWNERMNSQQKSNTDADLRIIVSLLSTATAQFSLTTGNFNGDAYDDIVMGNTDEAYGGNVGAGVVRVVKGDNYATGTILDTTNLTGEPNHYDPDLVLYGTDSGDGFGSAVRAGDVVGSNRPELMVTAWNGDGNNNALSNAGELYVFDFDTADAGLGTITPFDGSTNPAADAIYKVFGKGEGYQTGIPIAIGDVGGSAKTDLLFAATGGNGPDGTRPFAGEVYLVRGVQGGLPSPNPLNLATTTPDTTVYNDGSGNQYMGTPLACDINGDGVKDLGISTTSTADVAIVYGPIPLGTIDFASAPPNVTVIKTGMVAFGSVIDCGDMNKDKNGTNTLEDLVIGSRMEDAGIGKIDVVYGRTNWPTTMDLSETPPNVTIIGSEPNQEYGQAFVVGDFDADGFSDLFGSVPNANATGGRVYLTLSPRLASFQNPEGTDCWTHIAGPPEADVLCHDYVPSVDRWNYYQFNLDDWITANAIEGCRPNDAGSHVRFPFPTAPGSYGYIWFGAVNDAGTWKEQSRGISSDGLERNPPSNGLADENGTMFDPCP